MNTGSGETRVFVGHCWSGMAKKHQPPQEWYDEDISDLLDWSNWTVLCSQPPELEVDIPLLVEINDAQ